MTHANLLRSLQITLVTEIGDIVTTTSKQVTSSCGTVSRRDFLKKIQGREFSKFSELRVFFSKIPEFWKKTFKNLDKRFLQNDKKNCFWEFVYRSLSLLTGNEWWRYDDVMMTSIWHHDNTLMTSFYMTFCWSKFTFSVWILKISLKKFFENWEIRNFSSVWFLRSVDVHKNGRFGFCLERYVVQFILWPYFREWDVHDGTIQNPSPLQQI